jgi:hypothetical protein
VRSQTHGRRGGGMWMLQKRGRETRVCAVATHTAELSRGVSCVAWRQDSGRTLWTLWTLWTGLNVVGAFARSRVRETLQERARDDDDCESGTGLETGERQGEGAVGRLKQGGRTLEGLTRTRETIRGSRRQ